VQAWRYGGLDGLEERLEAEGRLKAVRRRLWKAAGRSGRRRGKVWKAVANSGEVSSRKTWRRTRKVVEKLKKGKWCRKLNKAVRGVQAHIGNGGGKGILTK
jgi:hypothetical protein